LVIQRIKDKITFKTQKFCGGYFRMPYFLAEFSYKEIAEKRKEQQMIQDNTKAAGYKDWFEQNKFIKEQIYLFQCKIPLEKNSEFNANYLTVGRLHRYSANEMNANSILDNTLPF
jgi:hypothetical protein